MLEVNVAFFVLTIAQVFAPDFCLSRTHLLHHYEPIQHHGSQKEVKQLDQRSWRNWLSKIGRNIEKTNSSNWTANRHYKPSQKYSKGMECFCSSLVEQELQSVAAVLQSSEVVGKLAITSLIFLSRWYCVEFVNYTLSQNFFCFRVHK